MWLQLRPYSGPQTLSRPGCIVLAMSISLDLRHRLRCAVKAHTCEVNGQMTVCW